MYDEYHREQEAEKWAEAKRWIERLINRLEGANDLISSCGVELDEEELQDERGFIQEAKEYYESM